MDRGAWWATVHGVTKIQTQLSDETATAVSTWIWVLCPHHTSAARTPPSSDPAPLSPRLGPRDANPWTQNLQSLAGTPQDTIRRRGPSVEPGTLSASLRPAGRCQVFALLSELLSTMSEFTCFLQKMRPVLGRGPPLFHPRGPATSF